LEGNGWGTEEKGKVCTVCSSGGQKEDRGFSNSFFKSRGKFKRQIDPAGRVNEGINKDRPKANLKGERLSTSDFWEGKCRGSRQGGLSSVVTTTTGRSRRGKGDSPGQQTVGKTGEKKKPLGGKKGGRVTGGRSRVTGQNHTKGAQKEKSFLRGAVPGEGFRGKVKKEETLRALRANR